MIRGGTDVDVAQINVGVTAHERYVEMVGKASRVEVREWLTNNVKTVRKFKDNAPYFIAVRDGYRFVFVENKHLDLPGCFVLVGVDLEWDP